MLRTHKTSKEPKKSSSKCEWFALCLIIIGAFLLRVLGQIHQVFVGNNVWFRGVDSWYHMRLADVVDFPQWIRWDFFAQYPRGAAVGYMPLLDWLSVSNTVAAFIPPICGVLVLVFVYLIGKNIFSGKVGLAAALLVAVLPGEFLQRSLLGFTDHHILESLLMSTSIYCLLRLKESWKVGWASLLGLSLGLYALTWTGVAVFYLIVGAWLWWECLQHLRHEKDFLPLVRSFGIATSIASLISIAYVERVTCVALLSLFAIPAMMWILTLVAKDKEKILFGLTVAIPIGVVLLGAFVNYRVLVMSVFWGGSNTSIREAVPLNIPTVFAAYGLAFPIALTSLYFFRKKDSLLIIWSIALAIMAIGQMRWGYYATIPVGILASAFAFKVGEWMQKTVRIAVVVVIIFFLTLPTVQNTIGIAQMPNEINADWYVTLTWLKQNTPNQEQFDKLYFSPVSKAPYGILSWWDYGHWVIRVAHRVPLTSPTQTGSIPSQFFTSDNETAANALLTKLTIPYVIIDSSLLTGKWSALLIRAEKPYEDVQNTFLQTLWNEKAQTWTKIYQRGDIKVYERVR